MQYLLTEEEYNEYMKLKYVGDETESEVPTEPDTMTGSLAEELLEMFAKADMEIQYDPIERANVMLMRVALDDVANNLINLIRSSIHSSNVHGLGTGH